MEKYQVLAKLFGVSARLRQDKVKHKQAQAREKTAEEQLWTKEIETLSNSGRNVLCSLKNNGSTNQRTLAKQMDISAQAVSETVKKLEQGGYITKEGGVQNNENFIALTPRGEEVADVLDRRIKQHAEVVLKNLNEQELETLYALLVKLET